MVSLEGHTTVFVVTYGAQYLYEASVNFCENLYFNSKEIIVLILRNFAFISSLRPSKPRT